MAEEPDIRVRVTGLIDGHEVVMTEIEIGDSNGFVKFEVQANRFPAPPHIIVTRVFRDGVALLDGNPHAL